MPVAMVTAQRPTFAGARMQRAARVVVRAEPKVAEKKAEAASKPRWWEQWKKAVVEDKTMVDVTESDTEKETELPDPTPAPEAPREYYSTADPRLSGDEVKMVLGLFDAWNAALASGKPENVADMYAKDGVLLPTVSNSVRSTREGLVDYFTNFLKLQPQGVIDEYGIRMEASDDNGDATVISNSGIYTFTFGVDGAKVQARFTYVYKKVDGKWLILSHHSSQLPTKLTPSPFTGKKYLSTSTSDEGLTKEEEKGVLNAFYKWNAALKTGDPANVVDCYAPDAILLPTVADDVRTTKEARRQYFVDFLKNEPQGELDEYHIRVFGRDALGLPNAVSNQGIYTFDLKAAGKKVQARYTYNYVRDGDRWLIKKHHSSAMPEATKA